MTINKQLDNKVLTVSLQGRLDTSTSPELDRELQASLDDVQKLIMDFQALEYVSSAGLRVLLSAQKRMSRQHGEMVVRNVNETINEVFELTGFIDILNIE